MMSRRRRGNTPAQNTAPAPSAAVGPTPDSAPDAALLARLEALENALDGGEDVGPVATHNQRVQATLARTTRPAGPGPVSHCPFCGTPDSESGWRQMETARNGWACTACADVVRPPYVNGQRTLPHPHEVAGLLASAYLGVQPMWWLVRFGSRFELDWDYATAPGSGSWSHVSDLGRWQEVAAEAVRRRKVGMDHRPPYDWEAHFNPPQAEIVLMPRMDWETGVTRLRPTEALPPAPDAAALARADREQLSREAKLVDKLLKDQERADKESVARASEAAGRDARVSEIHGHYQEHLRRVEQEAAIKREALRQAQQFALEREGLL